MTGGRYAEPLVCWRCDRPATWRVWESTGEANHAETLDTCDEHRTEAFS